MCLRGLVLAALICASWFTPTGPALAIDFPPARTGPVVDKAGILHQPTEQDLTDLLQRHEAATGNQIAVLTVPWLLGKTPEGYADTIAHLWNLGGADRRGVLILIAKREKQVWIEVGSGLEAALSRDLAGIIVEHQMRPAFRKGDAGLGTVRGVEAVVSVLEGGYITTPAYGSSGSRFYWFIGGIAGLAGLFAAVALYRGRHRTPHDPRATGRGSDRAGNVQFLSGDLSSSGTGGRSADFGGGGGGGDGGGGDG